MQLHALDEKGNKVNALEAIKQKDYFCMECQQIVRLRGGQHRHAHYFHYNPKIKCTLHAKSMAHLQTQIYLQSILPKDEVFLEKRFPSIKRVADVVLESKKWVFEIQCSPITIKEILSRNADYHSLGYRVIWIFHEMRYNQNFLLQVENYFHLFPVYYSDIDAEGKGMIYDQLYIAQKHFRKKTTPKLPVEINASHEHKKRWYYPKMVRGRLTIFPYFFKGDAIDHYLKGGYNECFKEKRLLNFCKMVYKKWLTKPFRLMYKSLLERSCK